MKTSTALVLLFLALMIGSVIVPKSQKRHQFKTAAEFPQWLATEATKDARENNHVTQDYSPEDIQSVKRILGGLDDP